MRPGGETSGGAGRGGAGRAGGGPGREVRLSIISPRERVWQDGDTQDGHPPLDVLYGYQGGLRMRLAAWLLSDARSVAGIQAGGRAAWRPSPHCKKARGVPNAGGRQDGICRCRNVRWMTSRGVATATVSPQTSAVAGPSKARTSRPASTVSPPRPHHAPPLRRTCECPPSTPSPTFPAIAGGGRRPPRPWEGERWTRRTGPRRDPQCTRDGAGFRAARSLDCMTSAKSCVLHIKSILW